MYSLQQQVFALSMFSNAASKQKGLVPDLQDFAKSAINSKLSNPIATAQIGSWRMVWGPIVFREGTADVADNAMVVYQGTNDGKPVYVVGIAATNSLSTFDIEVEDQDVGNVVRFDGNGALIAEGTSEGVQILEGMSDPAAGGALQAFLESKAASNATLIFAGHSLGGALAPTLALDLVKHHDFDPTKWANILVYPSAGATPGNQAFSDLFAQTFKPQPASGTDKWNAWNMDVVNDLDVVPRAWSQLDTLSTLYKQQLGLVLGVAAIVTGLNLKRRGQSYAILPPSSFSGQYNSSAPPPPTNPNRKRPTIPPNSPLGKYSAQAYYQHIQAYILTIIPDLKSLFPGNPA